MIKKIKIDWTLSFSEKLRGIFDEYCFFIYTDTEHWMEAISDIGDCINQHIDAGVKIKKVKISARHCFGQEVLDWQSLWKNF